MLTYTAAIRACGNTWMEGGMAVRAVQLWGQILQRGLHLDVPTYKAVIKA